MADIKPEHKPEDGENYAMANNTDPKNMQELTQFVSWTKIFYSVTVNFLNIFYHEFLRCKNFGNRYKRCYRECRTNFNPCRIKSSEEISFIMWQCVFCFFFFFFFFLELCLLCVAGRVHNLEIFYAVGFTAQRLREELARVYSGSSFRWGYRVFVKSEISAFWIGRNFWIFGLFRGWIFGVCFSKHLNFRSLTFSNFLSEFFKLLEFLEFFEFEFSEFGFFGFFEFSEFFLVWTFELFKFLEVEFFFNSLDFWGNFSNYLNFRNILNLNFSACLNFQSFSSLNFSNNFYFRNFFGSSFSNFWVNFSNYLNFRNFPSEFCGLFKFSEFF